MTSAAEALRFKPVASLDGLTYCSPRCGCGCTTADYQRATTKAAEVAAALGSGWEPRIWENCGWNCEVVKGDVSMHIHFNRKDQSYRYSAWIEPANTEIGHAKLQIIAFGATPEDALGNAVQDARTLMQRIDQSLKALHEDSY